MSSQVRKADMTQIQRTLKNTTVRKVAHAIVAATMLFMHPTRAHASLLHGEALDTVANILSWVVLIVAPAAGITIFWLVHILPEKIAEKKKHPQTKAIQTLCLLSLVFGGLLWPLAWLWAYTKPIGYKLAYGTDVDESIGHKGKEAKAPASPDTHSAEDPKRLQARIAELELKLASMSSQPAGGKV